MNANDTLLQGHQTSTCVRLGDFHLSYESLILVCVVFPSFHTLYQTKEYKNFTKEHLPGICFNIKSFKT